MGLGHFLLVIKLAETLSVKLIRSPQALTVTGFIQMQVYLRKETLS